MGLGAVRTLVRNFAPRDSTLWPFALGPVDATIVCVDLTDLRAKPRPGRPD